MLTWFYWEERPFIMGWNGGRMKLFSLFEHNIDRSGVFPVLIMFPVSSVIIYQTKRREAPQRIRTGRDSLSTER